MLMLTHTPFPPSTPLERGPLRKRLPLPSPPRLSCPWSTVPTPTTATLPCPTLMLMLTPTPFPPSTPSERGPLTRRPPL